MTYRCNRDENLDEKACQSMLYVFILDLQEILGTLLKNNTKDPHRLKLVENGAVQDSELGPTPVCYNPQWRHVPHSSIFLLLLCNMEKFCCFNEQ